MSTNTEMLALYIQAEKDVLQGKVVNFNGQQMTLEDLDKIREGRREYETRVANESSSAPYSVATWE